MENYTIGGMITGADEISALFGNNEVEETAEEQKKETTDTQEKPEEEQETAETIDPLSLFKEDEDKDEEKKSEKVGKSEEDNAEDLEREPPKDKKTGSSPETLYSSIANSLAEDGTLSNLSEEDIKEIKDAESLVAAMKKQVDSMLDDTQKRINDALNAGLEPSQVQQYEQAIQYLNNLTEEDVTAETQEGENLRKTLIYQYQVSLGLNQDRATKMVERAFAGGTDIEDAKEYLELLKEKYQNDYKNLINEGKEQAKLAKQKQEEEIKKFKKTLMEDKTILGDLAIDAKTREKAFDNWMKPTYKNEQGQYQSAIQKYIAENPADFQMKVALLFTMTDGFTKMGNVLTQTVKKEKKKAIKDLEAVINNTQRTNSGLLDLSAGDDDANFRGVKFAPPESWYK